MGCCGRDVNRRMVVMVVMVMMTSVNQRYFVSRITRTQQRRGWDGGDIWSFHVRLEDCVTLRHSVIRHSIIGASSFVILSCASVVLLLCCSSLLLSSPLLISSLLSSPLVLVHLSLSCICHQLCLDQACELKFLGLFSSPVRRR